MDIKLYFPPATAGGLGFWGEQSRVTETHSNKQSFRTQTKPWSKADNSALLVHAGAECKKIQLPSEFSVSPEVPPSWGRRRRKRTKCGVFTASGSSRTRRFWYSTRRLSTSSAMCVIRSSPPRAECSYTSSKSTRSLSPSECLLWIILGFGGGFDALGTNLCRGALCLGNYGIPVDFLLLLDISFVQFNARTE